MNNIWTCAVETKSVILRIILAYSLIAEVYLEDNLHFKIHHLFQDIATMCIFLIFSIENTFPRYNGE